MANFRADPIDTETINSISGSGTDLTFNARSLKVDRYGASLNLSESINASNVASAAAGRGQIWVSGSTPTTLVFRDDAGTDSVIPLGASIDRHLINMPAPQSASVDFRGWASFGCTLVKAKAYNAVTNNSGSFILTITNGSSTTLLNTASFNMNTLSDNTVTSLGLTHTASDLNFAENDRWTIKLDSNNSLMNADGIYIDLTFRVTSSF